MRKILNLILVFSIMGSALLATAADRVVPAAPQEYLDKKNPVDGNKEAIAKGAKLYEKKCAKCHGAKGMAEGKSAKDLTPPVTAFANPGYLKARKDGQLFYVIEQGSKNTDMEGFGPGTSYNFSIDDIWNLVAFMRSKFQK